MTIYFGVQRLVPDWIKVKGAKKGIYAYRNHEKFGIYWLELELGQIGYNKKIDSKEFLLGKFLVDIHGF